MYEWLTKFIDTLYSLHGLPYSYANDFPRGKIDQFVLLPDKPTTRFERDRDGQLCVVRRYGDRLCLPVVIPNVPETQEIEAVTLRRIDLNNNVIIGGIGNYGLYPVIITFRGVKEWLHGNRLTYKYMPDCQALYCWSEADYISDTARYYEVTHWCYWLCKRKTEPQEETRKVSEWLAKDLYNQTYRSSRL